VWHRSHDSLRTSRSGRPPRLKFNQLDDRLGLVHGEGERLNDGAH
jgi:hypothetical protein